MVFRSQLIQLNGSLGIVIYIPLGAFSFIYPVESVLNYIQQNHYAHPLPKNERKTGLPRYLLILFKFPHIRITKASRGGFLCLTGLDVTNITKDELNFVKGKG